jgi:hypothetical protein
MLFRFSSLRETVMGRKAGFGGKFDTSGGILSYSEGPRNIYAGSIGPPNNRWRSLHVRAFYSVRSGGIGIGILNVVQATPMPPSQVVGGNVQPVP